MLKAKPYPLEGMENPRSRPEHRGHALDENIEAIRKSSGGKENGKIVLPKIELKDLRRS